MTKLLMYKKKRSSKSAELVKARSRRKSLRAEEDQLKQQVEELEEITPELETKVEENADALAAAESAIADLEEEIATLDEKITELEGADPEPDDDPDNEEGGAGVRSRTPGGAARSSLIASARFNCRSRCFSTRAARDAFYAQKDIKDFLDHVRALARAQRASKRSVTGADLNIPTLMLDLMRDNLGDYSKIISHVRKRQVKGTARQNIIGDIPEGIWMEARGALNELNFDFTQVEVDGFKVGGVIFVANSDLEDSDVNLGEEILTMIMYAIGHASDLAIIYGKGRDDKMPVGIVTRLAQTSQPSYWGNHQGEWTDLRSSNILKLNIASETGPTFFTTLLAALGKAKPNYATGGTFWVMNRATHLDLLARALNFNAAGALVAGMQNSMPVENGDIIEFEDIPDYEIVGGFGDLYLMVEREGGKLSSSDLPRWVEDQTGFKGTARYDGQPVRGEGFVAVNYNNVDVTTTYDFAKDYANTAMNALICTAAQGGTAGKTVVTVVGAKADSPDLKYAVGYTGEIKVGGTVGTEFADLTSGTTAITAAAGAVITVVELDAKDRIVSAGSVISVPKAS